MIILQNVSKSYGHRRILDNISFNCPANARIALVGNNGAGKSTLINIICGFDTDHYGSIIIPRGVRIGFLPQSPHYSAGNTLLSEAMTGAKELASVIQERDTLLAQLEEHYCPDALDRYTHLEEQFTELGGYRVEEDAKNILFGLGFKEQQLEEPVTKLSGGWKMRVELAKILLDKPNFLVLDEPTNHLDFPSIQWFEGYLQKFAGTILFVSHDKDMLNRLATHVLHLRNGELSAYKGNFDDFLEEFSLKQSQNTHVAKHLKQQYDHIEQFVNKFRAKPTKARQVQSRLKALARLRVLENDLHFEELQDSMDLRIKNANPSGHEVLKITDLSIGYEKSLLRPLSFRVERGQRVAILGANGLGKSTLLKTLLGITQPLSGEVRWGNKVVSGYFAQEHSGGLNKSATALENVRSAASTISEREARQLLGALGISGDMALKQVGVFSGGEQNRTALACMLAQAPNVLCLDEPTNHLDLSACESLAQALTEFTGTVIFVSHNRAFINAVATHVLYLQPKVPARLEEVSDI